MSLPTPYYESDRVKLFHGDCLSILPHLSGVDAVVTDPPYGIGDKMQGGTWGAAAKYADFRRWDVAPSGEDLANMIGLGRLAVVWGGNYFALPPSRCWLAWDKHNAVPTMADVELAWTNLDRPAKRFRAPVGVHQHGHPTEKPLPLMLWCIEQIGPADTIADPYMGVGTTGVAAIRLGRRFVGIEQDEGYCAIAKRRIQDAEQAFALFEPIKPETQAQMFTEENA